MQQPASFRFRTLGKWILRVFLFQFLLINISAAFHAHRLTHFYDSDRVRNLPPSQGTFFLRTWRLMVGRPFPKAEVNYFPPFPYDTVSFETGSGLRIQAWKAGVDSAKGTVILFHGLNSTRGDVLSEAMSFMDMGYNILMPDLRAHGASEGTANSLGIKETEEVKLAFDHVKTSGEDNIILYGMSLGAVIITRAIAKEGIEPQKVILDMPFNRLQDHLRARARVLGFPPEPFGFLVTFWAGLEQGYWGYGHQTERYVKKISCPVLVQWGQQDKYVDEKEIQSIFQNLGSAEKHLVVYPEAGHERLLGVDPQRWENRVETFLGSDQRRIVTGVPEGI